jgi:hypothetical protein
MTACAGTGETPQNTNWFLISIICNVTNPSQTAFLFEPLARIRKGNQRPYAALVEPSLRQKGDGLADRVGVA